MTFAGNELQKIGAGSFYRTSIAEFQAPPSLKEIGDGAFAHCMSLKLAVLNENITTLSGTFESSGVHNVVLPSTLKRLDKRTFCNCKNLRNI